MKRIVSCIFIFLAACCRVHAYGHLPEIPVCRAGTFLADRLLLHKPTDYCIAEPKNQTSFLPKQHAELYLKSALREWTYGVALRIRAAGREQEFADIVAVLERPVSFEEAADCSARPEKAALLITLGAACPAPARSNRIFFNYTAAGQPFICLFPGYENPLRPLNPFLSRYPAPGTARADLPPRTLFETIQNGGYSSALQKQLWNFNNALSTENTTYFSALAHELGHAFGLQDEYVSPRARQYASRTRGRGIMRYANESIGCDEVDGLITLLDRFGGKQRVFASFCPGRGLIVNGTETKNPPAAKRRLEQALRDAAR